MLYNLEQALEKNFGCQKKTRNYEIRFRTQNDHFYEFYPFSAFSVAIHRILDEFHATILEKNQKRKCAIFDFQPHF